jgi:hypothetical protein
VRLLPLLLAFTVAAAWAQDKPPEKKKMEKKKAPVAHKKATKEQIRRFNELEKKQQK